MKKRILVVEDDASLARVLRDNLAFEGFDVECAGDGHLAVDAARDFAPDLVILDVMLPGRDGFDLCGLLRQGGATPDHHADGPQPEGGQAQGPGASARTTTSPSPSTSRN